jgi:hypothetical protein
LSEQLEPLSPSEAAKILAGQRWNTDERAPPEQPASEDFPTGKRATEASFGYSEMPLANPVKQPDDAPIESSTINEALRGDQEAQVAEPIPVEYLHQGGSKAGEKMDSHLTVSAQQAAHDINQFRQAFATSEQAQLDAEIQRAVDELRAGDPQPQQEQQAQPQPDAPIALDQKITAQDVNQAPTGDDEVAAALRNPKVLAAVQETAQYYAATAEQARQAYAAGLAQNAAAAAYSLVGSFDELAGVPPDQIGVAISVLQKSNPARAAEITAHINQVRTLVNEHQKHQAAVQQQQQAQARQQFDVAARNADAEFDAYAKSQVTDAQLDEIKHEALSYLRDLGMTEEQVRWEYSNGSLRSYAAQRLVFDAVRYRRAMRGIEQKVARPVPVVQRPGSPLARAPDSEIQHKQLSDRLNKTGSVKDAAALLIARRNARR